MEMLRYAIYLPLTDLRSEVILMHVGSYNLVSEIKSSLKDMTSVALSDFRHDKRSCFLCCLYIWIALTGEKSSVDGVYLVIGTYLTHEDSHLRHADTLCARCDPWVHLRSTHVTCWRERKHLYTTLEESDIGGRSLTVPHAKNILSGVTLCFLGQRHL